MGYTHNEIDYGSITTKNKIGISKPIQNKELAGLTPEEIAEDFPNGLPGFLNALEINWNGANMYQVLGEGFEEYENITTTTQLLKLIAKVALMAKGQTTINDAELNIEYIG